MDLALSRAGYSIGPGWKYPTLSYEASSILSEPESTVWLQIQDELPNDAEEAIEAIPPAVVDRVVNVTIMGGHNVVGNVHQFQAPTVVAGDVGSLKSALEQLGVTQKEFGELEATLQADDDGGGRTAKKR